MCAFMAENSIGSIRNGRFSILTKIKGEEKRYVNPHLLSQRKTVQQGILKVFSVF